MNILNKINVLRIVSNHFDTLKNQNTNKHEFDDVLTFILLPILGSSCLTYFQIDLTESATNIIITTLAILVGLLFNVIVIIFDIIKRNNTKKLKNRILNELLTNISYSIIISILIIVTTLATHIPNKYIHLLTTWVVYFLIWHFFLTVFMILKRMYILFINELNEIENNE